MIRWSSGGGQVSKAVMLALVMLLCPYGIGTAADAGQELFQSLCTACHTIGKGKLIGPDLAGVTTRREEGWLKRQIKEPDKLIAENDPIVIQLLTESNNIPMAPLGLSADQVDAVIAYLRGTEQQAAVETDLPAQYLPTVIAGIAVVFGLTVIGIRTGQKKVNVD